MKDERLKLEEIEASHTLDGVGGAGGTGVTTSQGTNLATHLIKSERTAHHHTRLDLFSFCLTSTGNDAKSIWEITRVGRKGEPILLHERRGRQ